MVGPILCSSENPAQSPSITTMNGESNFSRQLNLQPNLFLALGELSPSGSCLREV